MLRLAFLLAVVVGVALATWQVVTTDPGTVTAEWNGWRIDTSAFFVIIAFVASLIVALPLLRLLLTLIDAPGRLGKANDRARMRRGQEALALGLIAAEAGEFDDARRHAAKAEDLIEEPRLAKLLEARAAEVSGDVAGAERAYSGMLGNEDTELLGRKGLLQAALKRGDRISAMSHAEAALRLSKTSTWPFQSLFDLKVQAGDWEGAIEALDQGEKRKLIEDRVARRRRAVLLTAAANRAERERRMDRASDLAQKAFRLVPGFAPAAAMSARMLVAEGKAERAAAVLEEAWENAPHPVLAHAYRDLKVGEGASERLARMQSLADRRRDSRESRIVLAELSMERGDWAGAQAALEDAYREFPSARICTLFAAVCRGRGDEQGARTWIAQAASAPREPDWSDLDPEGPAFLYDDTDWARLVYAYGDQGQLIHPRFEQGGRDAATGSFLALPPASDAPARQPPPDTIVEARVG
ncbi:MAG: tetratricopeptide repeat protein [Hyphomonadaceae bacterium]|nr:tetratricopeptide repeat protein [Hyphomonadaceae bacterium]